jgi:hypothetical protein
LILFKLNYLFGFKRKDPTPNELEAERKDQFEDKDMSALSVFEDKAYYKDGIQKDVKVYSQLTLNRSASKFGSKLDNRSVSNLSPNVLGNIQETK